MKKLTLKALNLDAKELLTREQKRMIFGGSGSGGSGGSGTDTCYKCKEKGEWVYGYGDCSSKSSCDANTCSTYSC